MKILLFHYIYPPSYDTSIGNVRVPRQHTACNSVLWPGSLNFRQDHRFRQFSRSQFRWSLLCPVDFAACSSEDLSSEEQAVKSTKHHWEQRSWLPENWKSRGFCRQLKTLVLGQGCMWCTSGASLHSRIFFQFFENGINENGILSTLSIKHQVGTR